MERFKYTYIARVVKQGECRHVNVPKRIHEHIDYIMGDNPTVEVTIEAIYPHEKMKKLKEYL
jgi:Uri superfamily endonuclease